MLFGEAYRVACSGVTSLTDTTHYISSHCIHTFICPSSHLQSPRHAPAVKCVCPPVQLAWSLPETSVIPVNTRYMWSHIYAHQAHGSTFYTRFPGDKHIIAQIFYRSSHWDESHKCWKHKDRSVLCKQQVNLSLQKGIGALMAPEGSGILKRNEKWQYVNVTVTSSEPSGSWLRARPTERVCMFPSKSLYFPAWDVSESLWG